MAKVLLVTPTLRVGGASRRLALLADVLRGDRDLTVAVLGVDSPLAGTLRAAGARVEIIPLGPADPDAESALSPFNPRPLIELRRLARSFDGGTVHAWGRLPLLALTLGGARHLNGLVASEALPPVRHVAWADAWLLRRVGRVAAHGAGEAERYRRLGVRAERVVTLPPAVEARPPAPPVQISGVPADARVILGLGPVEPHKGFLEAVWTFDIVRQTMKDVRLVVVGPGSDRGRVARFARDLRIADAVVLPGPVDDVGPWLARADLVWVPSLRPGGVGAALEAMAAGRPVLASRLPGLDEFIRDGETGVLVKAGDKPALARASRRLFENPDLRRRLGEAGRLRAAEFGIGALRQAVARLYGTAFASSYSGGA